MITPPSVVLILSKLGSGRSALAYWLLEDLPRLWEEADITDRRRILITMLEAVYVDTAEENAIAIHTPSLPSSPS